MTETSIPNHEYLTVRELAELLRLKERKVYDLAASGQVPCSRATGKLLFPAAEIRAWIAGHQSGQVQTAEAPAPPRPPIVLGSHDPLLDWAIRQSRCGLATYFDGSLDGLDRFVKREGVAAGLHIHDTQSDSWNVPPVARVCTGQNAVLIAFSARMRGLVYRPDGPQPQGLAALAGLRVVPRQPESGTDGLFREAARADGLDPDKVTFTAVARTEDEAVEAVRRGDADAAFGLESVARAYGLGFAPVLQEQFALLADRKAMFEPGLQTLLAFCRSEPFQRRAAASGGYDIGALGQVLWNA